MKPNSSEPMRSADRIEQILHKHRGTTHWVGCEKEHDLCFLMARICALEEAGRKAGEALKDISTGGYFNPAKYESIAREALTLLQQTLERKV